MTIEPEIVTIQDVRDAGYCGSGARRWFEGYGFDFRAFMKDGLPAETLLATGDALADAVVTKKRERDAAASENPDG